MSFTLLGGGGGGAGRGGVGDGGGGAGRGGVGAEGGSNHWFPQGQIPVTVKVGRIYNRVKSGTSRYRTAGTIGFPMDVPFPSTSQGTEHRI